MNTLSLLLSTSFALFLLMDAIGNIPLFISVLKNVDPKRQKAIIFRELVIALFVIIIFYFLGDLLLKVLNIQHSTLLLAGGFILFLIALKMVFPGPKDTSTESLSDKEPFIVPLAIPLVAGPAILAAVMLYAHEDSNNWIILGAILIAWTASLIILLGSTFLKKLLGERGLIACERLMGLLLILISVQMLSEGVSLFLKCNGLCPQP